MQVALMDGFVMGCSISDEVQLLQAECDVSLPSAEVPMSVWKRSVRRWYPQRSQVAGFDKVSPEAQLELGYDATMNFRPFPVTRRPISSLLNILAPLVVDGGDVEP